MGFEEALDRSVHADLAGACPHTSPECCIGAPELWISLGDGRMLYEITWHSSGSLERPLISTLRTVWPTDNGS